MDIYSNSIDVENDAIKKITDIDKKIIKEVSKGNMADDEKVTKLRFEQMLQGLYLTQDPMKINNFYI